MSICAPVEGRYVPAVSPMALHIAITVQPSKACVMVPCLVHWQAAADLPARSRTPSVPDSNSLHVPGLLLHVVLICGWQLSNISKPTPNIFVQS